MEMIITLLRVCGAHKTRGVWKGQQAGMVISRDTFLNNPEEKEGGKEGKRKKKVQLEESKNVQTEQFWDYHLIIAINHLTAASPSTPEILSKAI